MVCATFWTLANAPAAEPDPSERSRYRVVATHPATVQLMLPRCNSALGQVAVFHPLTKQRDLALRPRTVTGHGPVHQTVIDALGIALDLIILAEVEREPH